MFKAIVYVSLRERVLDPKGNAVHESLLSLG
ncbi:phosphoribosylformylglycinamidine synthase subunit PurS [Bacillus sp. UNC438CL73TsuS30]|nr:phosphoribosylformylglycinamidine synthase subunit PurS [Bacillus sp. UNC438CL73TsuS30]